MTGEQLDATIEPPLGGRPERGSERPRPVVVLLGWGGCKDQHLAKYSTVYRQRGCTVIRYTAPWRMVFFSESCSIRSLRTPAQQLLQLLFDHRLEKNPLLFHVFSNGGVMLYRYIVELLHTHRRFKYLRVVGTVFDSSPGRRNVLGSLRALAAILSSTNVLLRSSLLLVFAAMVVILRIMLYPLTRFLHENHYDALLKGPSRWPELYLYSKADKIIKASDIELMAEARRQHGVPVKAVDFLDSAHVSHLRAHPSCYTSLCGSFLSDCIGGS
ncbi:PREDICTED: transmembrane protein 53 isoform X1 [Crocodylus porosus]|uniref:transmembrane protein 53 isoform X1 n=1 Tax=Crocodylus porosus TaxID=8502 RepID=UPI00093EB79A|nr:PREDICTED: transmembrane protein 53 isoform X1 [Crocodylus porosus]